MIILKWFAFSQPHVEEQINEQYNDCRLIVVFAVYPRTQNHLSLIKVSLLNQTLIHLLGLGWVCWDIGFGTRA